MGKKKFTKKSDIVTHSAPAPFSGNKRFGGQKWKLKTKMEPAPLDVDTTITETVSELPWAHMKSYQKDSLISVTNGLGKAMQDYVMGNSYIIMESLPLAIYVDTNVQSSYADWFETMYGTLHPSYKFEEMHKNGTLPYPPPDTSIYRRRQRAKILADHAVESSKDFAERWEKDTLTKDDLITMMMNFAQVEVKLTQAFVAANTIAAPDPMKDFMARLDALASTGEQQQRLFRDDEI